HSHRADLAARDDRAGAANGLIEAVAVADDQPDAGAARRLDHRSAISEAQRHRLLDKHVLAGLGRELCMLRVKLVWRGDVNRLDRVVAAKLVDALISWRREFGAEAGTRLGAGIGRAGEPHPGMAAQRRQHELKGASETRNAQLQLPLAHRPLRPQGSIVMLVILSSGVRCDKRKGDGPKRRGSVTASVFAASIAAKGHGNGAARQAEGGRDGETALCLTGRAEHRPSGALDASRLAARAGGAHPSLRHYPWHVGVPARAVG